MLQEDQFCRTEFEGKTYDSRHGGPFDRGSADSWYSRGINPHYFPAGTYQDERIGVRNMTEDEVNAYLAGYAYNERFGGKKEY
jgi:hypothetical protein